MSYRRRCSYALLLAVAASAGLLAGGARTTAHAAGTTAPGVAVLRIGGSDMASVGDVSRYRYVVMQAAEWARIPALKSANPAVKVLAYEDMSLSTAWSCHNGVDDPYPSSGLGYCTTSTDHPDWFLTDTGGSRVMSAWYSGDWFMDIGSTAYQNAWAAAVVAALRAKGFDGVELDDANSDPSGHLGGKTLSRYPTVQSYRDATTSFLQNVCGQIRGAGFLALPNVDGGAPRALRSQWAGYCDGSLKEYWVKWGTSTDRQKVGADWADELAQLEDADAAGKILIPITYAPMSDTRDMTFARASFLLAWNGSSASALIWNTSGGDPWDASWTASVGSPLGPRRQVAGGVWRRDFSGGTVLVNSDPATTVSVALGGSYTDAVGATVTSVTLGPASGAILAGAAAPAVTTTAVTPTQAVTTTVKSASGGGSPPTTTAATTTAAAAPTTTAPSTATVAAPPSPQRTLGSTSSGELTAGQPTGTKYANRVSLTSPASLTRVRAYLAGTGGSFTESIRAVVYADASGVPGRLLGSTSASAFGGSLKPGWVELKFASALRLRSGTYWLGLQFGGATRVLRVGFVSGAAGIGRYNEDGWADGPSPVFGPGSGDHEAWSVYAVAASPSARLLDAKRTVKRARTKKQGHPKRPAAHRR